MNKKILIMLSALILMVYPMAAYAVDQTGNAATSVPYSVNYIVTTDTSFTVTLASASPQQTAMNFTGARNKLNVEPQGQDRLNSTSPKPWATINNTGEVIQDFKLSLNSLNPSTIELLVSNEFDMDPYITVTTELKSPVGWTDVAAGGGKAYLYAVANFRNTPDNPGSRTLSISSMEHQVLTSIVVSPVSASVPYGTTKNYTATGRDQFGNPMPVTVLWSNDNLDAGSINSTTGVFTAAGQVAIGNTTHINASSGGVFNNTATATIVAQPSVLTTIEVSPASANVPENRTQTYTATGKDQYGTSMTGITFTWSSDNPAAGSINPTTGVFTPTAGATAGTVAHINVSSGSVFNNTATATIAAPVTMTSISITPGTALIIGRGTAYFTAKDQLSYDITGLVTWHSSNELIGTIDSSGKFTSTNTDFGDTIVTATYGSLTSNSATVTVEAP